MPVQQTESVHLKRQRPASLQQHGERVGGTETEDVPGEHSRVRLSACVSLRVLGAVVHGEYDLPDVQS